MIALYAPGPPEPSHAPEDLARILAEAMDAYEGSPRARDNALVMVHLMGIGGIEDLEDSGPVFIDML